MGIASALARLVPALAKNNPAGEANWHAGPYHIIGRNGGFLPYSSVPWNFWQSDIDPIRGGGCSIVEACVWAYIRAIAQLPGYHRRELANGGVETVTNSALSRLLRTPNSYETLSDFLTHLIRSLLYTGNSYWIAQRNDRQEVVALHWTDPRQVSVREIAIAGQVFSEVFYEFTANPIVDLGQLFSTDVLVVPARDVLHVKLATPRHPLIGETWLAALAGELAQRSAINTSNTSLAGNMRPAGVLTTDKVLSHQQIDEIRERWKITSAGMAAGSVPILTNNLKFEPVTMSAEDAKTIEQLKLTDQTIAAVFGVPGVLLGLADSGTQKSAEAQMTEWLAAGLGWMINHIEVSIDSFVGLNAVPSWREWTEFDTRALLRSAFRERIEGLARGTISGIYSPNEARRLEGLPDAEFGDEPRVQQQVVPLSFANEPPPPPAPPAPPPADEGDAEEPPPRDAAPSVVDFRAKFRAMREAA